MFCYIKYCAASLGQSKIKIHKSSMQNRIQFASDLVTPDDLPILLQRITISGPPVFGDDSITFSSVTDRLVYEKSQELIQKFPGIKKVNSSADGSYLGKQVMAKKHTSKLSDLKRLSHRSIKVINKPSNGSRSMVVAFDEPNTVFLLNPDCYVQLLIDYIYDTMDAEKDENLDLCDADGNMVKLFDHQSCQNGKYLLHNRKTYYVVKYELNEDNSFKLIVPLIRKSNKEEADLFWKVTKNYAGQSVAPAGKTHRSSGKSSDK